MDVTTLDIPTMYDERPTLKYIEQFGYGPYMTKQRLDITPLTILCGANGSGKSTWMKVINNIQRAASQMDPTVSKNYSAADEEVQPESLLTSVETCGLNRTYVEHWKVKWAQGLEPTQLPKGFGKITLGYETYAGASDKWLERYIKLIDSIAESDDLVTEKIRDLISTNHTKLNSIKTPEYIRIEITPLPVAKIIHDFDKTIFRFDPVYDPELGDDNRPMLQISINEIENDQIKSFKIESMHFDTVIVEDLNDDNHLTKASPTVKKCLDTCLYNFMDLLSGMFFISGYRIPEGLDVTLNNKQELIRSVGKFGNLWKSRLIHFSNITGNLVSPPGPKRKSTSEAIAEYSKSRLESFKQKLKSNTLFHKAAIDYAEEQIKDRTENPMRGDIIPLVSAKLHDILGVDFYGDAYVPPEMADAVFVPQAFWRHTPGNTNHIGLKSKTVPIAIELDSFSTGVHNVAPMLTQTSLMLPNEAVYIESPEAHLHPTAITRLTEFFMSEATAGKNIIVETHSDLIIKRVMRGILSEELPQSNVTIYFSSIDGNASIIEKVEVNDHGQIMNWPPGFLEEESDEDDRLLDVMYGYDDDFDEDGEDEGV